MVKGGHFIMLSLTVTTPLPSLPPVITTLSSSEKCPAKSWTSVTRIPLNPYLTPLSVSSQDAAKLLPKTPVNFLNKLPITPTSPKIQHYNRLQTNPHQLPDTKVRLHANTNTYLPTHYTFDNAIDLDDLPCGFPYESARQIVLFAWEYLVGMSRLGLGFMERPWRHRSST